MGRTRCSEEVVILGVLRVVEEILNKKPNANIVINSLLPMAEFRGGFEPKKWEVSFWLIHVRSAKLK